MEPRVYIPLAVLLTLISSGSWATDLTYDFSTGMPVGATVSNVTRQNNQLSLRQGGTGDYAEEGYIEIPVSSLAGKSIQIDAERVNALDNGDFEASQTIYTYNAASSCGSCTNTTQSVGRWFTNAEYGNGIPTVSSSGGNHYVSLNRNHDHLIQYVKVSAGEDYTLSINDLDLSHLGEEADGTKQVFQVFLGFMDSHFHPLIMTDPYHNSTLAATTPYFTLAQFDNDDTVADVPFRIRVVDCDTHTKYTAGDGVASSSETFNFCKDSSGTSLSIVDENGSVMAASYTQSDMVYVNLRFNVSWVGTSAETEYDAYYATLDNIVLDREDQIEIELRNRTGTVLQSSVMDKGFYVDAGAAAGKLRVFLRSHQPTKTPKINSISIRDGFGLTVTAGDLVQSFTEPRIGFSGGIPPRSEWLDESRQLIRSVCVDPSDNTEKSCATYLVENGVTAYRVIFNPAQVEVYYDSARHDYHFRMTEALEFEYEHRLKPLVDAGMNNLTVLGLPSVTDIYLAMDQSLHTSYCATVGSANDCCYKDSGTSRVPRAWYEGIACSIDNFPDRSGGSRTGFNQIVHMVEAYLAYGVELFNGGAYTKKDGTTFTMPSATIFEFYGEPNRDSQLSDPLTTVWGTMTQDEKNNLISSAGNALREAGATTVISPSVLADGNQQQMVQLDFMQQILAEWDQNAFTNFNFHPYKNSYSFTPEQLAVDEAPTIASYLATAGWNTQSWFTTEWGFSGEIYDPYCNAYNSSTGKFENDGTSAKPYWSRSVGELERAKLVARQTLTQLALPISKMFLYGWFTFEQEYGGGNVTTGTTYPCWKMDSAASYHTIFKRRSGTGILDASSEDEASVYETIHQAPHIKIASYLSVSSPYSSDIQINETSTASDNEHYYSALLKTDEANTYVLGLWWYKDYFYAPSTMFLNYLYGPMDNGFTEKRIHQVTLKGLGAVSSATLISLEGETDQILALSTDADGYPVIQGAVFGEMPVLVRLTLATGTSGSSTIESSASASSPGANSTSVNSTSANSTSVSSTSVSSSSGSTSTSGNTTTTSNTGTNNGETSNSTGDGSASPSSSSGTSDDDGDATTTPSFRLSGSGCSLHREL